MKSLRCFSFSFPNFDKPFETRGWESGLNEDDARRRIAMEYDLNEAHAKVIHLRDQGTWDDFINTGDTKGWD